jgi:transcriptional regulator with XRE-family HTH domain
MDVIAHIMTLAKERDWTQYRLAREANLPQTTIANIYNRGSVPSIVTLEMICKAFDMTLSEFFMCDADK